MPLPIRVVGIAWYRREDYARIFKIMIDADKLPTTWEKWSYAAEKGLRGFQKQGILVEKVYLDPDEFLRWCAARRHNIDAKARMVFANEIVAAKHRSTH